MKTTFYKKGCKLLLGAVCLGLTCCCGLKAKEAMSPPFPAPAPELIEELKHCPLKDMPAFQDWLNRLYILQAQLAVE